MDIEQQIETLRGNLETLKKQRKEKKVKKVKPRPEPISAPIPSTSKPKKEPKPTPLKKKGSSKKVVIPDNDALSFEQKKELSEAIQSLEGDKLEKVIGIIHEGVPEIRDVRLDFFRHSRPTQRRGFHSHRVRKRLSSRSINFLL